MLTTDIDVAVRDAITRVNPDIRDDDTPFVECQDALEALRGARPIRGIVKENWVGALRSGEFDQTKGTLRRLYPDGDRQVGYCCLGVLSCIDSKVEWEEEVNSFRFPGGPFSLGEDADGSHYAGALPPAEYALERWGMESAVRENLATLNDNGVDFDLIADIIEAYL